MPDPDAIRERRLPVISKRPLGRLPNLIVGQDVGARRAPSKRNRVWHRAAESSNATPPPVTRPDLRRAGIRPAGQSTRIYTRRLVNRSGRFVVAISLLGLLLAVVAAPAGAAPAAGDRAQIGMMLRLHELPGGYTVGDEFGCTGIGAEGARPALAKFVEHHFVGACEAQYDRRYALPGKGPDPPLVVSAVLDFGDPRTARAGAAILPELVARLTGNIIPRKGVTAVAIGTETRLFHGKANVLGHGHLGSILTWRQGRLIGMTLVAGEAGHADDRIAAELARVQRSHMSRPTPYPARERDDVTVPLENPAITLPIYWLGRNFDPGAGAKPLPLTSAYGPLLEGEAPEGTKLELWYEQGDLHLGTWTPESWGTYTAGKLGHELLAWHCTKKTRLQVPEGTATIYGGYKRNYGACPSGPPNVFAAVVERGGLVIGMGLPACYTCLGAGPSRAELEAAVGALELFRPRP
jgi:hypothetical protein